MGEPEAPAPRGAADVYFLLVAASNLVTALVPSETACLAGMLTVTVPLGA